MQPINFSNVNSPKHSFPNSRDKEERLGKLINFPHKGLLLAHLINFKLYQKSNNIEKQVVELTIIQDILNEPNSSITFDEVQHWLPSESVLFQNQLPYPFRQAIIDLINNGGSEYQKFVNNLVPNSKDFLEENAIPNLTIITKYILVRDKINSWVNIAPAGERDARLTAKLRFQEAFENNSKFLDLSSLQLTTIPTNIFYNLTNLQVLDLSNNYLKTLPDNAFDGLANLTKLFLSGN
ncbi:MAG: leucine-rich repeat domain-containing protein, partial [Burkholderiales bacterium]